MSRGKLRSSKLYTQHNKVRLVRCGSPYFTALKELIDRAQHSIHLQVYIFDSDETGQEVAAALKEAARRGVKVYLMPDGYASKNISHHFIEDLKKAGIHFRFFEPVLRSEHFYFGRRLHHKVVVADAQYCLVGGINISNRYNDMDGDPSWMDWALYAEGQVAIELFKVCIELWTRPGTSRRNKSFYHNLPHNFPPEECKVRIRRNDWVHRRIQISGSYIEMLRQAHSHVIIMSSYFLPGTIIRNNLSRASRRGIRIRLILSGKSDVAVAKQAERYVYRWLLKRNIEIYEYMPTVLHGKLATRDNEWVTVGSYNVNDISAYASVELNLDVANASFAKEVNEELEDIIANQCMRVTAETYRTKYHFIQRARQYISYYFVRVLFYLFTFYFKQRS